MSSPYAALKKSTDDTAVAASPAEGKQASIQQQIYDRLDPPWFDDDTDQVPPNRLLYRPDFILQHNRTFGVPELTASELVCHTCKQQFKTPKKLFKHFTDSYWKYDECREGEENEALRVRLCLRRAGTKQSSLEALMSHLLAEHDPDWIDTLPMLRDFLQYTSYREAFEVVGSATAKGRGTTSELMAAITDIGFHDDGDAEKVIKDIHAPAQPKSALWLRVL
jgi:hypothetical protein